MCFVTWFADSSLVTFDPPPPKKNPKKKCFFSCWWAGRDDLLRKIAKIIVLLFRCSFLIMAWDWLSEVDKIVSQHDVCLFFNASITVTFWGFEVVQIVQKTFDMILITSYSTVSVHVSADEMSCETIHNAFIARMSCQNKSSLGNWFYMFMQ